MHRCSSLLKISGSTAATEGVYSVQEYSSIIHKRQKAFDRQKAAEPVSFCAFFGFWQKYQVNLTVCHFISAASYGEAEVLFLIGFSFPLRLQTFTDFYSIFLDVSHCPARDISVLLSKFYCICHVTNSTRSAAELLLLLVFSPGTVFWTLSTTQTPPKLLSCAC